MENLLTLSESNELLKIGGVLAYPTEAVFGLGCDPDCESAVLHILQLKQRSIEKGLILIASHYQQLFDYIDERAITEQQKKLVITNLTRPTTWILPKNKSTPYFLTGRFDSIAVRITNHPVVCQLCDLFDKPIVSTSANISNHDPCRSVAEVRAQFGETFPILQGELGNSAMPSEIKNIKTGQVVRQG